MEQGCAEAETARKVGVHRQSVSRWARQLAAGGREALRKAPRTGRKPRLSEADRRRIVAGLKRGPEALGYEAGLWTSWRVADLIERQCGVRYTNVHVWRILRGLGWSCQRPVGRALERDEKAIRHWKQACWPEVKKRPKTRAHHRLPRRIGTERETPSKADVGATGTDAGVAIPLHLEDALGGGWHYVVEFLLPSVSGNDPQPAGG